MWLLLVLDIMQAEIDENCDEVDSERQASSETENPPVQPTIPHVQNKVSMQQSSWSMGHDSWKGYYIIVIKLYNFETLWH